MPLTRRQLLQASGVLMCAGMLPSRANAETETKLSIPPLLEAVKGQPLFLSLQRAQWEFIPGVRTSVLGFNGLYLGPTIRVRKGDNTKLICSNQLDQRVSLALNGLQLPGILIGNVVRMLQPETSWSPILPIRQSATTCWYHANTPGKMAEQVYQGLAGMWIIEDPELSGLNLPAEYGVNDIPVIIQDKRFTYSGALEYNPLNNKAFFGDVLLANGIENAVVEVSRGWIRLRLLNASNARRYDLTLSDGRPFKVIATDLGLLSAPITLSHLSLAPGERYEVLIDMSQTEEIAIISGPARKIMDQLKALIEPSDLLRSNTVLTVRATGQHSAFILPIAERFLADSTLAPTVATVRQITLNSDPATINGAAWDEKRIDFQVKQGSVERWVVSANQPQSFHIQGAEFLIQRRNGQPIAMDDMGWKDTVWIDGQVELLVKFTQSASDRFPLYYGSQTLEFASRGAVGQFITI